MFWRGNEKMNFNFRFCYSAFLDYGKLFPVFNPACSNRSLTVNQHHNVASPATEGFEEVLLLPIRKCNMRSGISYILTKKTSHCYSFAFQCQRVIVIFLPKNHCVRVSEKKINRHTDTLASQARLSHPPNHPITRSTNPTGCTL